MLSKITAALALAMVITVLVPGSISMSFAQSGDAPVSCFAYASPR
ncbi:MAG: hypothetical protein ACREMY_17185 [bacterium]